MGRDPLARRRWPLRLAVVAGLLALLWLARAPLLAGAARFLDVSEPPHAVDFVLILGGGTETRPFAAAALVRAGLARRVLLSRVRRSPDQEDEITLTEADLTRRILLARGVPDGALATLPDEVDSTRDEARSLARFLDAEPSATVAIVTNPSHTRRARMLFRRALGQRMSQVHFVAAPDDDFGPDDWWRHEGGVATYATEYVKLVFYGLTGERSWQATAILVVVLLAALAVVRRRRRRP